MILLKITGKRPIARKVLSSQLNLRPKNSKPVDLVIALIVTRRIAWIKARVLRP
jgi:hypothetical protein